MLLDELALLEGRAHEEAAGIAGMMGAGGWLWGPLILAHLGLSAARCKWLQIRLLHSLLDKIRCLSHRCGFPIKVLACFIT